MSGIWDRLRNSKNQILNGVLIIILIGVGLQNLLLESGAVSFILGVLFTGGGLLALYALIIGESMIDTVRRYS